jgi:hypothetical protein
MKDGLLEGLHDEPRFQELMAQMEEKVAAMRLRVTSLAERWEPSQAQ